MRTAHHVRIGSENAMVPANEFGSDTESPAPIMRDTPMVNWCLPFRYSMNERSR